MNQPVDATRPREIPPGNHVFREPWEARVFALAVSMSQAGYFNWAQWTQALGERTKVSRCGEATYEAWLDTLESLLITIAAADRCALGVLREAWREAAASTPHGRPIELAPRLVAAIAAPGGRR